MFRLARCLDLITARCLHPRLLFDADDFIRADGVPRPLDPLSRYTIKQMGCFFCGEHLDQNPGQVLEVGAGYSPYFARRLHSHDYWAIDEPGFYDPALLERGRAARPAHTFVEGLMGRENTLPDNAFDVVFSVSVLEHVAYGDIAAVCRDIRRVTKRGGLTVHSIDVTPQTTQTGGQLWLRGMLEAGFQPVGDIDLSWDYNVPYEREILVEPLMFTYETYGRATFEKPIIRPYTWGSILALFRAE